MLYMLERITELERLEVGKNVKEKLEGTGRRVCKTMWNGNRGGIEMGDIKLVETQ